jgi:acyl-CoA thioesterase-1
MKSHRNLSLALTLAAIFLAAAHAKETVKVFVLAGDENMLRQGSIDAIPDGARLKRLPAAEAEALPGTLLNVLREKPQYAFLRDSAGNWATRSDVAIYDAHPLSNNTRDPAKPLGVTTDPTDSRGYGVGAELMFGNTVGDAVNDPVLLVRFATKHETWFQRGSRSLGYDYLSPTGGGGLDLDGGWDVIHFNHGVWDLATFDSATGKRAVEGNIQPRTSPEDYEKNLRAIVARLKQTKATLIWAHTTPILEGTPPGYAAGETVDQYNAIATKVMNENGVIINDLNAECRRMGKPKALNVHDVGSLAPKVTDAVKAALAARKNPSRPLPRVLFIGDSITGSYWAGVKTNLDGIAFVAKNPGNGEHTGTGARLVDSWVDLKQYLLNGQEYLELVGGVKEALSNIDRYAPDFAGRKPELAGIVWFQGIADIASPAFAAAYEKNLTGLIQDLRKEFNQPELPFVVAALAPHGDRVKENQAKVHAAQMAVGKSLPNITSIDTAPFYFPKEKSPSGHYNNAESYLLIGEAMGKAMLESLKK